MVGMDEFELKRSYKLQMVAQQTTLGHFRIELLCAQIFMNPDLFDLLKYKVLFEHLLESLTDFWNNNIAVSEEAMDIREMTTEEAMQDMMIGDAPESIRIVTEISKSPCTLGPKKYKQHMVLVCMSPRNPLRIKITMEEKGKAINLETDDEEEDLEEILVEDEEDEKMEEETQGANLG